MKKSVYRIQSNDLDLEIMLDVKRELTEKDELNLMSHAQDIVNSIREETMNLDPEVKKKAAEERESILSLFPEKSKIFVEEVPNEYAIKPYGNHYPWYKITTPKGRVKIGWRKRVLNICWDETVINKTAKELFPDEDVTKFDKTIHAWGYAKAREYIYLILRDG